jgi:hypothetical protein
LLMRAIVGRALPPETASSAIRIDQPGPAECPEHSAGTIKAGAAPSAPRPSAGAVAIVAAAAATVLGTTFVVDTASAAVQVLAAVAVAALTLALVPLAAGKRLRSDTYIVASAAAGAAAIHYAVIAEHFDEWWGFGLFFVSIAVAQLVWAVVVVASSSRLLMWFGVVGNAAIIALWIVTRTAGTLLGPEPHAPEPVAVADSVATALEMALVVVGTRLLATAPTKRALSQRLAWTVSGVTLALTSVGLLSVLDLAGL